MVSFNEIGDIVISSASDNKITLWNWETGGAKLTLASGHSNLICQAKFIQDSTILTCGADGEVRCIEIDDSGSATTALLTKHEEGASKLVIGPGSSQIFYSCGEDGFIHQVDLRTLIATKLFKCYSNSITCRHVELYDIAMDPSRLSYHLAAAGSDNYARVYDIRGCNRDGPNDYFEPVHRVCLSHLIPNNNAKIGALSFTDQSELLVSYLRENIYFFINGTTPQVYRGHENSVHSNSLNLFTQGMNSFGPNSDFVTSGSDCGRIFIWKKNGVDLKRVLDSGSNKVNCIECHPQSMVFASTGQGSCCVKIWQLDMIKRGVHPVTIHRPTKPSGGNLERGDLE